MLDTFLLLTHHLILNLLLCTHLLLDKFSLLLFTSFHLLSLDHLFQRVVLDVFLLLDDLHKVTLFTLLILYCVYITLNLFFEVATSHIHVLAVLLLDGAVLSLTEHLFLLLLSLSFLAFLLHLHIALSCNEYVIGPLLGFIELLPRLLLFLLEQCDSIGEKLVVFLSPFSRHLRGNQFAVQGLIIVVLIDVQVHLVSRGELRAVQLVVQVVVIVFLILLLLCG